MSTGWTEISFDEACTDVSSLAGKAPQTSWLEHGKIPLIDQGDSDIAGYIDDQKLVFRGDLPVIAFGDHTRRFKFVDHPFAIGADGVKILRPSTDVGPRYLFWFLRTRDIPSVGYSRHFKFLKRITVPLPPPDEQRRIARVLDAADALRTRRLRARSLAAQLNQSLFAEMFGNGVGGNTLPLGDLIADERPITYGILKPGPHVPDGVPYVRVVDMAEDGIQLDSIRRTTPGIAHEYRRSTLEAGDLLMSIRGHVGRLAVVPDELVGANITQDSARLAVEEYEPRFVMEAIRSPSVQSWMRKRIKGVAVQGINLEDVRKIPVPCADLAAQERFTSRAAGSDAVLEVMRSQLRHLDSLFASLSHRAFTGAL